MLNKGDQNPRSSFHKVEDMMRRENKDSELNPSQAQKAK